MLRRDRYRGVLVWGRVEKTYRGGTKVRVARPDREWTTVEVPELRIIDDALWTAVQTRTAKRAVFTGTKKQGARPRYLLTGLARCAACGGPIHAMNTKISYDNVRAYGCSWHRDRGAAVCPNGLRRPVSSIDNAVLEWVRANILQEQLVLETLKEVRRRLGERAKTSNTERPEIDAQIQAAKIEIDRLGAALLSTDDKPQAIVKMIADREKRIGALEARLNAIRVAPSVLDLEVRRMEKEARSRINDLKAAMQRDPEEARKAMEALLKGPLKFTPVQAPEGKRYRIEGDFAVKGLFRSVGVPSATRTVWNAQNPAGFQVFLEDTGLLDLCR
jgi:hypothetical protein